MCDMGASGQELMEVLCGMADTVWMIALDEDRVEFERTAQRVGDR